MSAAAADFKEIKRVRGHYSSINDTVFNAISNTYLKSTLV